MLSMGLSRERFNTTSSERHGCPLATNYLLVREGVLVLGRTRGCALADGEGQGYCH